MDEKDKSALDWAFAQLEQLPPPQTWADYQRSWELTIHEDGTVELKENPCSSKAV
jgi:hypothetical protein